MEINILTPAGAFVEEVQFNLGALTSRNGPTIDTRDWFGSTQADFTENRQFGFPLLDGVVRPPGNLNVNLQVGIPTFPIAEPPAFGSFLTILTIGAPAGVPTPIQFRIPSRFLRLQFTDTSGAANNGIYHVLFLRGA